MAQKLDLRANFANEVTTSNKAGVHNLIIEPGDQFVCRYKIYSPDPDNVGERIPYDISKYSITAIAHDPDWGLSFTQPGTKIDFAIEKLDEDPPTGAIHIVKFSLTPEQTTTIGVNPWFSWGMRFTEILDNTNSFTFITGTIYAQEGSYI